MKRILFTSMPNKNKPVYKEIADSIEQKIGQGAFSLSKKIPSQHGICYMYNISYVTACRVQEELEKRGLIYRIRGKGAFLSPSALNVHLTQNNAMENKQIRRLAVFFYLESEKREIGPTNEAILTGIQKKAIELGMPVRVVYFVEGKKNNWKVAEDEGLIIPFKGKCESFFPILDHNRMKSVLINNYYTYTTCLVPDNHRLMTKLLNALRKLGCRRIDLCTDNFIQLMGIANLSEKTYAFEYEAQRLGLEYEIHRDGDYFKLIDKLKKAETCPDALCFIAQITADTLSEMLCGVKLAKKPLLAVCDHLALEDRNRYISVNIDYRALGEKAVELFAENTLDNWRLPKIIHVEGTQELILPKQLVAEVNGSPL